MKRFILLALALLGQNSFADGRIKNIDINSAAQIDYSKMADVATSTIIGRVAGGSGAVTALSVAQVTGLLGVAADAFDLSFTPTVPGNWTTAPDNVGDALDEVGARVREVPLTFTLPLLRTVNAISIPLATTIADGYLSSTKFTDFQSAFTDTSAATSANTPSTIVKRDGSGNFVAGTITAALTGNSSTSSALASNPSDCASDTYAHTIAANGNLTCSTVTDAGLATPYIKADGSRSLSSDWNAGAHDITATTFIGALTGNSSTSTALAANPSDCASDTYAHTIAASGNLTCSTVTDAGLAVSYLKADGSRSLSSNWNAGAHDITATTFIGALTGNASTSSAFASNPTDCGPGTFATAIDTAGNLTCSSAGTPSPLTTKGDLYTFSTLEDRLPVGTNGQILTPNSGAATGLNWVTALPTAAVPAFTGDVTNSAGSLSTTIANNAVTNAKAAQMAAHTFKGNNTGSTANAIDLTATQLTAELNTFTSGLQGLVPASGGGTTNFLRADGSFAAPTGTGDFSSNTATSVDGEVVLFSGTGGKTGKRATGTGFAKLTSGVLSAQSSPIPAADLNGGRTVNPQTGTTYTLALADGSAAGGFPLVSLANGSPITLTVPTNGTIAFPVGTQVDFSVDGSGAVTVVGAGGVTLNAAGSTVIPASGGGTLLKVATDTWNLFTGSSAAVTSFTGDVVGAGPGATATTIANLAVTNAKIANSTIDLTAKVTGILPNANTTATASAGNSTIVARDGSGNFAAGTITAALTGTASGNLQATATNHGVLISGSANTASVTAVGATNTLLHGNTGADPTYSAIVNADITNATIDLSTKVNGSLLAAANLPAPALSTISASDVDWATLKNVDGAYTKTLSANTTFTFSNIVAGQTIVMFITNTASNFTLAWPASAHFPAGTAPTQTVGAKLDVITCKAVSTSVAYCQSVQNFTP